jgi:glycerol-3-phosphate acyltransferase PlsY
MLGEIILLVAAYLLGSFPFMLLVSRAKGFDLSNEPDHHIAMYRKVGRGIGLLGILVDVLKGALSVFIGFWLNYPIIITAAAGILATLGQMWPVFQKFNGEKGNTTGGGTMLALCLCYNAYWVLIVGVCIWAIGFLIRTIPRFLASGQTLNEKFGLGGPPSNSLPIAMLAGFAVCPLLFWLWNKPVELTIASLIIFIAIVIRRLTAGVRKDIVLRKTGVCRILLNRFLLDRSFY